MLSHENHDGKVNPIAANAESWIRHSESDLAGKSYSQWLRSIKHETERSKAGVFSLKIREYSLTFVDSQANRN